MIECYECFREIELGDELLYQDSTANKYCSSACLVDALIRWGEATWRPVSDWIDEEEDEDAE